ncbi:MAG: biotin/lipoyl-containing protein [Mycobacteriales bacterium]
MGLTPDDLRELLEVFEGSTWQEMTVNVSGDSLHVSRRAEAAPAAAAEPAVVGASPTPATMSPAVAATSASPEPAAAGAAEPATTAAATSVAGGAPGTPVSAPSVGLFWRAPSPGAPPFVDVGSRVAAEDAIGIVEVMKLMSRVPAGVAGVVTAVLVENGGMVEHGQPLVLIDTSA